MAKAPTAPATRNRYEAIIEKIFQRHHEKGAMQFAFNRDEREAVAKQLKIVLPKNLGDFYNNKLIIAPSFPRSGNDGKLMLE